MSLREITFSSFCLLVSVFSAASATAQTSIMDIVEEYDAFLLEHSPDARARETGVAASEWPDVTPQGALEAQRELTRLYDLLNGMDSEALSEQDSLNRAILATQISDYLTTLALDEERMRIGGHIGFQMDVTSGISRTVIRNEADVVATIARLNAVPAYLDDVRANLERGLAEGFVAYEDPLKDSTDQLRAQVDAPIEETHFFAPFLHLPDNISEDRQAELTEEARAATLTAQGAFADILTFLEEDYAPHTRELPGIGTVPGGEAYYQTVLVLHTTREDLTPQAVHEIGLSEVARIRGQMDEIIEEVGFEGSFEEFLAFLRTDPQFYAQTPEELMIRAARIAKDLDYYMPAYFGVLPRQPYGVVPVPEAIAPGFSTGLYFPADMDQGQPGEYWVNTYALDQRPLYELPALTAHEAVPGHHHQIALMQELEGVPEFRRNFFSTAFIEGWGLYSETLAGEMGLYKTPYERFGKLSYEMWRACRLVADTGMHAMGWTREEAEACFLENTALAPLNIETEVTRYISWPGQALAYKIGELTILGLRDEAREALGYDFDIRAFHDEVLGQGALPLGLLETRIRAWIDEQAAE